MNKVLTACMLAFALLLVRHSALISMQQHPLGPTSWELQDPVVGFMTFVPGQRVLKREVLDNHQALWSNLKHMGAPLLANEVQSAPMFPLTLILSVLPDHLYWNVFVCLRIFLLLFGGFLLALQCFSWNWRSSLIFAVLFGYSCFPSRWLNHPWHNGLLAGVWLIYFTARSWRDQSLWLYSKKQNLLWLGQVISIYSLLTCGFPESTALMSLLSFLVLLPFVISFLISTKDRKQKLSQLFLTGLACFIAVSFASPQLFALNEYVQQSGSEFRRNYGLDQYPSINIILNFLWPVDNKRLDYVGHGFGLLGCFFFFLAPFGYYDEIKSKLIKDRVIYLWDAGALLLLVFFFLKLLPLWPTFNTFIGSLPIYNQTHFTVYFLQLLIWPFAYFVGRSFEYWIVINQKIKSFVPTVSILVLVVTILYAVLLNYKGLPFKPPYLGPFGVLLLAIVTLSFLNFKSKWAYVCSIGIAFLLVIETFKSYPHHFLETNSHLAQILFKAPWTYDEMRDYLKKNNIDSLNYRERSPFAKGAIGGVATPDNGASAILTERSKVFREILFRGQGSSGSPYMGIEAPLLPYSWDLVGGSLAFVLPEEAQKIEKGEGISRNLEWDDPQLLSSLNGFVGIFDKTRLPRAYLADNCILVNDINDAKNILVGGESFKRGTVLLENSSSDSLSQSVSNLPKKICAETKRSRWEKSIIEEDRGTSIQVRAQGPGILVLQDSFYPGWHAYESATKVLEIYPANINHRAILLSEVKEYKIQFKYEPIWWKYAIKSMVGSLILLIIYFMLSFRKRRISSRHTLAPR